MRKLGFAFLAALMAALMTVLMAACSSSGGGSGSGKSTASSGSGSAAGNPTITISSYAYSGDLTVQPGAKVTVINKDAVPHTLTDKATLKFDTGNINAGATGTFTAPTKPGSYPFGCRYHSMMKGVLVVQ